MYLNQKREYHARGSLRGCWTVGQDIANDFWDSFKLIV